MNSFLKYANMRPRSERPNAAVIATKKHIAERGSEKQKQFHKDLVVFLKAHGLNTAAFEKPRDGRECGHYISGMFTVLKKRGLYDEFFNSKSEEKA